MEHAYNPYQTPSVDLADHRAFGEIDQTSVFSPNGRFTRMSFVAWSVAFNMLVSVVLMFVLGLVFGSTGGMGGALGLAQIVSSLAVTILGIIFAIRRLHDMDASGWWVLLYLVPIVNLVFSLVVLFKRGSVVDNQYGPPRPTTGGERIAGIVGIVILSLIPIAILAAIAIPAYNGYIQQAQMLQGG